MYNFKGDMKWLMQCAGKTKHASLASAEFAVDFHNDKTKVPYFCKYCKHWHLGTSTKKEKKK